MVTDKVKFCYDNLVRQGTLSGSSQLSPYFLSNIAEGRVISEWRTGGYFSITTLNNMIDFEETAGSELTATLTTGGYSITALCAEIKTQLEVAGASTYDVTYDETTGKFTIESDGLGGGGIFKLLFNTGSNADYTVGTTLGYTITADKTGGLSYTSDNIVLHTEEYFKLSLDSNEAVKAILLESLNLSGSATIELEGCSTSTFKDLVTSDHVLYTDFSLGLDDLSSAENDLTDNNTVGYAASSVRRENVIVLNGTDEYLSIADADAGDFEFYTTGGVDFTIEVRILPDDLASAEPIISKWDGSKGWKLEKLVDNTIKFTISDGANTASITSSSAVVNTAYSAIAVTCDWSGNLNLYINGVVDAAPVSMSSVGDIKSAANFYIGREGAAYFDGNIWRVRVSHSILTATEVYNNLHYPEYFLSGSLASDVDGDLYDRYYITLDQTLRYWRVTFEDRDNSDLYLSLKKAFIGDWFEFRLDDSGNKVSYAYGDKVNLELPNSKIYSDDQKLIGYTEKSLRQTLDFRIPFTIDRNKLEKLVKTWKSFPYMWVLMLANTYLYERTYYSFLTNMQPDSTSALDLHTVNFSFEVL